MKRHAAIALFLLSSLMSGILFWFACEDRMKFDVYAGETFWYDEPFNLKAKLVITALAGLAAGLLATSGLLFGRAVAGKLKAKGKNGGLT